MHTCDKAITTTSLSAELSHTGDNLHSNCIWMLPTFNVWVFIEIIPHVNINNSEPVSDKPPRPPLCNMHNKRFTGIKS